MTESKWRVVNEHGEVFTHEAFAKFAGNDAPTIDEARGLSTELTAKLVQWLQLRHIPYEVVADE